MTAINRSLHDVHGVRLPLQTSYATVASPVFMLTGGGSDEHAALRHGTRIVQRCISPDHILSTHSPHTSTPSPGSVSIKLEPSSEDERRSGVTLRYPTTPDDAMLSVIAYHESELLHEGTLDVLLNASDLQSADSSAGGGAFDLFDPESGHDLTLSPQTFTSSAEAFINDNSDSLGMPVDDAGSQEDKVCESGKPASKKSRPKSSSPIRQGPQQCLTCGKIFGNASALAKHKLTHSDERKFVCTMCGKAFKRQDHLNGHMLTHRNKKPFECKTEGCGKSYCDARSLRRHTENHHASSSTTSTTSSNTTTNIGTLIVKSSDSVPSVSSAVFTSSSDYINKQDDSNSDQHMGGCIQYAPPPPYTTSTHGSTTTTSTQSSSQLHQLLTFPTPSSSASSASSDSSWQSNTVSVKQDFVDVATSTTSGSFLMISNPSVSNTSSRSHSIEDQQNQSGNESQTSPSTLCSDGLTKQQLDLIQQIMAQTQQQQAKHQQPAPAKPRNWAVQNTTFSAGTSKSTSATVVKQESKPVECNLCHRKFKNIPALNGHMRLHGGYFKKESEAKKSDKKESNGPPLQTASISVRALIEEKIIQKRISHPQPATSQATCSHGTESVNHITSCCHRDHTPKTTAVIFSHANPHVTLAQALSSTTLTSTAIIAPIQCTSDMMVNSIIPLTPINPVTQHKESFVLPPVPPEKSRRHSDSDHFLTPPQPQLAQVVTTTNTALNDLLKKKAAKRGLRATSDPSDAFVFHDNGCDVELMDDQQCGSLQLPLSAEAYASANYSLNFQSMPSDANEYFDAQLSDDVFPQVSVPESVILQGMDPAHLQALDASQLQDVVPLQDSVQLQEQFQALQSQFQKLTEDYKGAFPSPSHTLSPFAYPPQSPKDTSPLTYPPSSASPLQQNSPHFTYPTPPSSQEGHPSPLFTHSLPTSTMLQFHGSLTQSDTNAPSQPVIVDPALSVLYPNISAGSPTTTTLPPLLATGGMEVCQESSQFFPTTAPTPPSPKSSPSPLFSLQMMPNSDDPLLSSSPKDFGSRKRFEFSYTSGGVIKGPRERRASSNSEVGSQTPTRSIAVSNSDNLCVNTKKNGEVSSCNEQELLALLRQQTLVSHHNILTSEGEGSAVFLSPNSIVQSSSSRSSRKKSRPEPLHIPAPGTFHSYLRSPRSWEHHRGSLPPYTPPPMLSPVRSGPGLFWSVIRTTGNPRLSLTGVAPSPGNPAYSPCVLPPKSDACPHVNLGPDFQASIPAVRYDYQEVWKQKNPEDVLWDPSLELKYTPEEMDLYLEFACCAAVPGAGHNKEYALHLLYMCKGNIHDAMFQLMQSTPLLPANHPLLTYSYNECDKWTPTEIDAFQQSLWKYSKDFFHTAKEVGTKTTKQCVQMYYFWKKVCPGEYRQLRLLWQQREADRQIECKINDLGGERAQLAKREERSYVQNHTSTTASIEHKIFSCEFPDCKSMFNSKSALNSHARVHGRGPSPKIFPCGESRDEFPCKVCGKVFNKVKSRSAHMKSHRPPDAEPRKAKSESVPKSESVAQSPSSTPLVAGHS